MAGEPVSLKARREALGLSLRDVEQITAGEVSNAYLSQLENGKIKNPSLSIARTLAGAYFVSIEQIADALQIEAPEAPPTCSECGRPLSHG